MSRYDDPFDRPADYGRRRPQAPSVSPMVLFLLVVGLGVLGLWLYRASTGAPQVTDADRLKYGVARTVTPGGDLAADEKAMIGLYKNLTPSVVHITSLANVRDRFSLNVYQVPLGSGSGFVGSITMGVQRS